MDEFTSPKVNKYTIDDLVVFVKSNAFLFSRFFGKKTASQNTIDKFEEKLNVKLPEDYRRFLSEFGYLMIDGENDIYGIARDRLDCELYINAAELTLRLREKSNLPPYYVAFYDDEGDEQWCFDTRKDHPNVVVWDFFNQCVDREFKTDFVNTIFGWICDAVETLEEDDELEKPVKWPKEKA